MQFLGDWTIPTIIRDYPEWHLGRADYGVWHLCLENEEVCNKVEAAKEHLCDFLMSPYQRQPHITLFVCGFLASYPLAEPRRDDDYGIEQLQLHVQALKHAEIKEFSIEIGDLNSFASAPFLEVDDLEGGIGRVRAVLAKTAREIRRSKYIPHLTVGLYSGAFPSADIAGKIDSFRSNPVRFRVERITFATYLAHELTGTLTRRCDIALLPG